MAEVMCSMGDEEAVWLPSIREFDVQVRKRGRRCCGQSYRFRHEVT